MDKRYITGTIFLTIAVVVAVVFTDAKYREMLTISNTLQKKENEFKGQQILIKEVGVLNKEFAANIKDLKIIDKYLPVSKNIADLLLQIDYMSSRNGLVMKDINFSSQVKKSAGSGKYSVISISLKMAGSYNSFLNFAEDVKNSIHLMDIVTFNIKAEKIELKEEDSIDEGAGQEPVLNFDVNIDTYYQ